MLDQEDQERLPIILSQELHLLTLRIVKGFWENLFHDVLKAQTLKNDFAVAESVTTYFDAVNYLRDNLTQLCNKYGINLHEKRSVIASPSKQIEFTITFCHYGITKCLLNTISIIVCKKDIALRILPIQLLLKVFQLEEYALLQNIVQDLFAEVCNEHSQRLEHLFLQSEHINKISTNNLTVKMVEIAKNSIKALYESSNQLNKYIEQYNLYTLIRIDDRIIYILHKDFLENPDVLLQQLQ